MSFIGVIDSGVGGLTVLQSLKRQNADFRYVADQAYCPYGVRSPSDLLQRLNLLIKRLQQDGATAIVLACNTASTLAPTLQRQNTLPIYEIITPTCLKAAKITRTKRVALLATHLTVRSGVYQKKLETLGVQTVGFDCSALVPYAESGQVRTKQCADAIHETLRELPKANVDTVILGCTHFPLLTEQIAPYCNGAQTVESVCDAQFAPTSRMPTVRYLTTDTAERAAALSDRTGVTFEHMDV